MRDESLFPRSRLRGPSHWLQAFGFFGRFTGSSNPLTRTNASPPPLGLFEADGRKPESIRRMAIAWCAGLALLGALALIMSLLISPARAHSWFTGEKDPVTGSSCCDDRDCFEIADTDVLSVAGGYVYAPLDNGRGPSPSNPGFVPAARVKSSASFGYAVCIGGGSAGMYGVAVQPFVRCFFAPSGF